MMLKKRHFAKNKLAVSVSIALAASPFGAAYAQGEDSGMVEEEIVVTGIRGSLKRAQDVKMNSTGVVEAISAEDIGKLPDSSIAESLARLPGLAGERRNGRVSGIALRGFREDYIGTTLNGRELIGIGDNRGVDFDLYPSEIISGAVVHKAADVTLGGSGIAGTVDLQTVRPLEANRTLTINGAIEQDEIGDLNPDYDDTGHRLALSYTDSYMDGTLGVSLTVATTESPNHSEFPNLWGYTNSAFDPGATATIDGEEVSLDGVFAPQGTDYANVTRVLERDTVAAVVQFAPTDNFTATVDFLFVDFEDSGVKRGINQGFNYESDGSGVRAITNGFVTEASTGPFDTVIRTDPLIKEGELTTFGINLEYQASENWTIGFDAALSESEKQEQQSESYAGNGRVGHGLQGDAASRSWTVGENGIIQFNDGVGSNNVTVGNYDEVYLAGPQGWGGGLASVDEFSNANAVAAITARGGDQAALDNIAGIGTVNSQDGFDNNKVFEESLDAFELSVSGDFDHKFFKSLTAGVRYTSHEKSKDNLGFFLTSPADVWPDFETIPTQFRDGTTTLAYSGSGLGEVVVYDAEALIASGYYQRTAAADLEPDRSADTYSISEQDFTQFLQIDYEIGNDIRYFGNFGFQAVSNYTTIDNVNTSTNDEFRVETTANSIETDYFRFLPSLNMNFDFGNGHLVRFAAARTISRARIDELTPGRWVRFDFAATKVASTDPQTSAWTGAQGNPDVQPYETEQFDLSYEWYFSDIGYLSLGYFVKDLINWNASTQEVQDFSDSFIPGFHQTIDGDGNVVLPGTFQGLASVVESGLTGRVNGFETQISLPFGDFVDGLDGLGLVVSGSLQRGNLSNGSRIPGLSEYVRQATVYYERAGFEIRVAGTGRSEFLSEQGGTSNSLVPVNRSSSTQVDAQISYDFADSGIPGLEGLRVSLQGLNLTDDLDIYSDTNSGGITRPERYGSRYLLNFNYSIF